MPRASTKMLFRCLEWASLLLIAFITLDAGTAMAHGVSHGSYCDTLKSEDGVDIFREGLPAIPGSCCHDPRTCSEKPFKLCCLEKSKEPALLRSKNKNSPEPGSPQHWGTSLLCLNTGEHVLFQKWLGGLGPPLKIFILNATFIC